MNEQIEYFFACLDFHLGRGLEAQDAIGQTVEEYAYVYDLNKIKKEVIMLKEVKCIESQYYEYESETLGKIEIHISDGKFRNATFHFSGNYSREQWRELVAIEAKITELEAKIS